MTPDERDAYLRESRGLALTTIKSWIPVEGPDRALYQAMLQYPLREAKGLRPALCVATSRAFGGKLSECAPSAAVIELYHNAFLIHDDVEDGSERRRGESTLHREVGEASAINVGDAMLALSLRPLLDNMRLLDLGRALQLLELVAEMSIESAEGQAMELAWIREARWDITPADYERMVEKKTAFYTFITPMLMGAIIAEAPREHHVHVKALARSLGIAFQIKDDLLNLEADPAVMGKEACGDLWEGKRTLMLAHLFASGSPEVSERALAVLKKPRPDPRFARDIEMPAVLDKLREDGEISDAAFEVLSPRFERRQVKTQEEIAELRTMLIAGGCLEAARARATEHAADARRHWDTLSGCLVASVHRDFLSTIVDYVVGRER